MKEKKRYQLDPANAMFAIYILALFCMILFSLVDSAEASESDPAKLSQNISMDEVSRGELLFLENNQYYPAPDLSRKIDMQVNGLTARITVKQEFINRSEQTKEAIYVFPLSEKSAVDSLKMSIGERVIIGQIKEKEEAKQIYKAAKAAGKKASLLVQKRPNMFSTKVANIGPGETIQIEISYQQIVNYKDGVFSLRFPMAITPRYQPQDMVIRGTEGDILIDDSGWGFEPTSLATLDEQTSPISIDIMLKAGMELSCLSSLYHNIEKEKNGLGSYHVTMAQTSESSHDFVLEWQPKKSSLINAAVFNEVKDDQNYSLIMLMPPQVPSKNDIARQVTFIIDVSGSMSGESMRQAKDGLLAALDQLTPKDSFNIISFSHQFHKLYDAPIKASSEELKNAKQYVDNLRADGGTEMLGALQAALFQEDSIATEQGAKQIGQIVFITDGAIDNENQLFQLIHENVEDNRFFTVGIGSAPNSYFMTRAAEAGRGSYTYIGKSSEVQAKMVGMFSKISKPVATNINIVGTDATNVEIFPSRIPDLYAGEPLILTVRSPKKLNEIKIEGDGSNGKWTSNLPLAKAAPKGGLDTIWAREKIKSIMDLEYLGERKDWIKEEVTSTALKYHLVSQFTSLVAVEELPEVEEQKISESLAKPLAANKMMKSSPAIFAGGSQTATPAQLMQALGALAMVLSLVLMVLLRRRSI